MPSHSRLKVVVLLRVISVGMRRFLHDRLLLPLIGLIRQGVTPNQLSLSLALGVCISCFPVLGVTTILCTVTALSLSLNVPAILLANWTAVPLQLLLLIPLIRLGERVFGSPRLSLAPAQIATMFQAEPWKMTLQLWTWVWHAIVAWALVAPIACVLMILPLRFLLGRLTIWQKPEPPAPSI